jgi:TonB family protein
MTFVASLVAEKPQYSPTPPILQIPPPSATNMKSRALALSAPRPKYPEYARKRHWVGVGWYVMNIDKETGIVTSVEIMQSTGHKILDQCVLDALQQWRFQPETVSKVKTPVTFAMPAQKSAN